jgi:hypothetical protein
MPKQIGTFRTEITGIPCQVKVLHHFRQLPWTGLTPAPSDLDYTGFVEFDYYILDRLGYRADWLKSKINPAIERRLLEEYES